MLLNGFAMRFSTSLAVFLALIALARSQAPTLKTSPQGTVVVKKDETFEFKCTSPVKPIESCSVSFQSSSMKVQNNFKSDVYEYFGDGYENGDCGIRFLKTGLEKEGLVTCKVSFFNEDYESTASVNLTIHEAPIVVIKSNQDLYEYKENETMKISCSAKAGRPLPTITMLIGDVPSDKSPSEVVLQKNASYHYNNKKVICRAENVVSKSEESRTLTIFFPPRVPDALNEEHTCKFDESEGNECIVSVAFNAHPKPYKVEWQRAGENLDIEKYIPVTELEMRTDGLWEAKLVIKRVSEDDFGAEPFEALATNDYGTAKLAVNLTADDETGGIFTLLFAIIVCVILVIVIVAAAFIIKKGIIFGSDGKEESRRENPEEGETNN